MNLHILVVEDEDVWSKAIISILEPKNYSIDIAQNYVEANNYLTNGEIDLLLVDLHLGPDSENRDGVFILKDAYKQGIPAIVITSYGTQAMIEKANAYDVVKFFPKKRLDPELLLQSIEEVSKYQNSSHKPTRKKERKLNNLLKKLIAGEEIK